MLELSSSINHLASSEGFLLPQIISFSSAGGPWVEATYELLPEMIRIDRLVPADE
jgi:hypothetical protein